MPKSATYKLLLGRLRHYNIGYAQPSRTRFYPRRQPHTLYTYESGPINHQWIAAAARPDPASIGDLLDTL